MRRPRRPSLYAWNSEREYNILIFNTTLSKEAKQILFAQGMRVSFGNRISFEQNAVGEVHSVEDVLAWLGILGLQEYAEKFSKNEIDGEVLLTLSSEELRDDLAVVKLSHRRRILDGIHGLSSKLRKPNAEPLPEHGRILDHHSNTRTYHFWLRVGTQLLAFSLLILQLSPNFRGAAFITAFSVYLNISSIATLLYGIFRYILVQEMIENSGTHTIKYSPDRVGVTMIAVLVLLSSGFGFVLILLQSVSAL